MKRKGVLDSSALLTFLQKEPGSEIVKKEIEKAQEDGDPLLINLVNFGEIYYLIKKRFGPKILEEILALIEELPIHLYPVSKELMVLAANIKADYNFPFVDSICAATAIKEEGYLLTADFDFKKIEKKLTIHWVK